SSDPDGDALTYAWDFGDGATGTGVAPTHAYTTLGNHTVTLVVNDGTTSSAPATATVTITNQSPIAHAGGPYSGVRNQAIAFNGSASSDPDGDTLTYAWTFGDGVTGTGVAPTHAYAAIGTYTVTLVVSDGTASSAPATTTTTISNRAPVANAGPDQAVELGTSVMLSGSGSSDPDGDTLGYVWRDAGGAIVGTGPTVVLTLPVGAYNFTLTVDDGHGGSANDGVVVTVSDTTAPAVAVTAPESAQILTG